MGGTEPGHHEEFLENIANAILDDMDALQSAQHAAKR